MDKAIQRVAVDASRYSHPLHEYAVLSEIIERLNCAGGDPHEQIPSIT